MIVAVVVLYPLKRLLATKAINIANTQHPDTLIPDQPIQMAGAHHTLADQANRNPLTRRSLAVCT